MSTQEPSQAIIARAAFSASVWTKICSVYAREGVSLQCLRLQDGSGVDVPFLLFAILADRAGLGASDAEYQSLVEGAAIWRETAILPLRTLRRALRADADEQAFRETVKRTELAAERRQVARLAERFSLMSGTDAFATRYLRDCGLSQVEIAQTTAWLTAASAQDPLGGQNG